MPATTCTRSTPGSHPRQGRRRRPRGPAGVRTRTRTPAVGHVPRGQGWRSRKRPGAPGSLGIPLAVAWRRPGRVSGRGCWGRSGVGARVAGPGAAPGAPSLLERGHAESGLLTRGAPARPEGPGCRASTAGQRGRAWALPRPSRLLGRQPALCPAARALCAGRWRWALRGRGPGPGGRGG